MKPVLRAIIGSVFVLLLAGCNSGEDFSDADVPGCPFGAPCREVERGNVFIELAGPRVANIGYACRNSEGNALALAFTSDQDREATGEEDVIIPAYQAQCPSSTRFIEYFIGNALFEGEFYSLGRFFLPQVEGQGDEDGREFYQVATADLGKAPLRVAADDPEARNRAALLSAFDANNPALADTVRLPQELHLIVDRQKANLEIKGDFDQASYGAFQEHWQPLLDRLNDDAAGSFIYPFQADAENLARQGINRTRAGSYQIAYQGNLYIGTEKRLKSDSGIAAAQITMPLLVLPDGTLLGTGTAALSVVDDNNNRDDRRDLLLPSAGALLQEDGTFAGFSLTGALAEEETGLAVQGRMLGSFVYDGVVGADGESDYQLNLKGTGYRLQAADKGRLDGSLLGKANTDILQTDETPKGLPLRLAKTAFASSTLNPVVLDGMAGVYALQIMRVCSEAEIEDGDSGCAPIPSAEIGNDPSLNNYPECLRGRANEEGCALEVSHEKVREVNDIGEVLIRITGAGADQGMIYTCKQGDSPALPVGLVGEIIEPNDGDLNRASLVISLTSGLEQQEKLGHFGTFIQGAMKLDGVNRGETLLRRGEAGFEAGVRATWTDDYLPQKIAVEADEDPDDVLLDDFLVNQRGAVELSYHGPDCP